MHGKVVLLCTDVARTWRQVSPPLAGAGNAVLQAATTEQALELVRAGAVDLVLFDAASGLDAAAVIGAARGRIPVVGLAGEDRRAALVDLVCHHGVFNVCSPRLDEAGGLLFDPAELVATAEKILRRDCFGLGKYLAGFGIELSHHVVVRADERDAVVDRLTALVRELGGGRRVVDSVALVADELITNAVYNAPRGADGAPRYAHVSRREKITLQPTEYVRVEYGADGRTFGLAVIDSFGALMPSTIRAGVHRCLTETEQIEQKAGGAGIGLYTALSQANQLVINLEPGARTEVIALWDLTRRGRGAAMAAGSLHLFAQDRAAGGRRAADTEVDGLEAVPEPSVTLSDSVRQDICAAVGGARAMVSLSAGGARVSMLQADAPEVVSGVVEGRASDSGAVTTRQPGNDLFAMRQIVLLRRSDRPGLHTVLAKIRGSTSLAPGMEAALTHLVNRWPAATLLCRMGGTLVPWTGAGDLEGWDELAGTPIRIGEGGGWLAERTARAGLSAGPLEADAVARFLGRRMLGAERGEGLAMSIALDGEVLFLLLAARPEGAPHRLISDEDEPMRYELLQRELTRMCERLAQDGPIAEQLGTSWAIA